MNWSTMTIDNWTTSETSRSVNHTVGASDTVAYIWVYLGSITGISGTPTFGGVNVPAPILNFNGTPLLNGRAGIFEISRGRGRQSRRAILDSRGV